VVKAIKLARFTKAPPLSWIDKPLGAPEPNDLILASGRHIASWKPLKMFGIVRSYLVHAPIST
jgi:hypothetical protein